VAGLITSQSNAQLEDYETMSADMLLKKLERIVRTTFEDKQYPLYALTADNFLKMALIASYNFQ
jgi:hypothetical protein